VEVAIPAEVGGLPAVQVNAIARRSGGHDSATFVKAIVRAEDSSHHALFESSEQAEGENEGTVNAICIAKLPEGFC
jgi:hypothetical protein